MEEKIYYDMVNKGLNRDSATCKNPDKYDFNPDKEEFEAQYLSDLGILYAVLITSSTTIVF